MLDVAAAFYAAGLDAQLAQGHKSTPAFISPTAPSTEETTTLPARDATSSPPTATPGVTSPPWAGGGVPPARLADPRVRSVRVRHGVLTLVFRGKPSGVQAHVEVYARQRDSAFPTLARNVRVTGDRLRTRVSGTLSQVSITYRDPTGVRGQSAPLSLRP
jgi:hypothetical protein